VRSPQCPCSPIGTAQSTDCALSSDVSEWLPIECDLSVFPQGAGERIAAQLDKGQALDLRWTIVGLFISWYVAQLLGVIHRHYPHCG
jgi:hypothetical protein